MALKILIAEDEQITLKHLVNTLRAEGYHVLGVQNGKEVLRTLEHENFDLLITDIKMPQMTGIELLPIVKSSNPGMEVIVITGSGTIGSAVETVMMGAVDFITKPFDLDELITKVGIILEKKSCPGTH